MDMSWPCTFKIIDAEKSFSNRIFNHCPWELSFCSICWLSLEPREPRPVVLLISAAHLHIYRISVPNSQGSVRFISECKLFELSLFQLGSLCQYVWTVNSSPSSRKAPCHSAMPDKIWHSPFADAVYLSHAMSNAPALSNSGLPSLITIPSKPVLLVLESEIKRRRQAVPPHRRTYVHPRYVAPII
jgi:hypothetical protein